MKPNQFVKTRVGIGAFAIAMLMSGCLDKENLYNPDQGKNQLPPESDYFDFKLRGDVKLSVNYNAPGFQGLIEVYDENPLEMVDKSYYLKKEGLKPIYTAYTDKNGKFEGTMYIATALKEAYLYTSCWGLPQCVKLELSNEGAVFDITKTVITPRSRSISSRASFTGTEQPFGIGQRLDNVWSLCKWGDYGALPSEYVSKTSTVNGENIADISTRVQHVFDINVGNCAKFLSDASVTNITIPQNETTLDIVFLSERAAFDNTLGYYYYKEGQAPTTREELNKLKKYIVFPRINVNDWPFVMNGGQTAQLKFFGENHDQKATSNFPKGYVIGWFFISDAYNANFSPYDTVKESTLNLNGNTIFFSNDVGQYKRFVSLDDKKSGIVVLGFEDQVNLDPKSEDYSDALFIVRSSSNISNEERPAIPDEKPDVKPGIDYLNGTLCFEDNWPSGGDYDLNDVAVEYGRDIEFDAQNNATEITESFKFVQRSDAATYNNFFAYQVNDISNIISKSDGILVEEGTKSIVINKSAKNSIGQTFTIVRKINGNINKDELKKPDYFNPYIIVGSYPSEKRVEVHLPTYKATSFADASLNNTQGDAYYRDKDGKYPFAIDIPIIEFGLSPERDNIGKTYPNFNKWVESNGANYNDWYKK